MKERRIVKRTRENGYEDYVVEERRILFGKVISDWHTAINKVRSPSMAYNEYAIFSHLYEAQRFCGINTNPIVKKEIVL